MVYVRWRRLYSIHICIFKSQFPLHTIDITFFRTEKYVIHFISWRNTHIHPGKPLAKMNLADRLVNIPRHPLSTFIISIPVRLKQWFRSGWVDFSPYHLFPCLQSGGRMGQKNVLNRHQNANDRKALRLENGKRGFVTLLWQICT